MIHRPNTTPSNQAFRHDIQGLRAVAVVLVVLWHGGASFVKNGYVGVDAFFVISGFLITGLILAERTSTGAIDLKQFYARRAKRLLPASGFVIVATLILAWLFIPEIRWTRLRGDALASTFYLENWRLAAQSIDYVSQGDAASPFQHFWSLAVEEQFYLVWPFLIKLATPSGAIGSGKFNRNLSFLFGSVLVASLAWSVLLTASSPGRAYFVTTTRAWEFALGAILALYTRQKDFRPLQRSSAAAAGWGGAVLLLASAVYLPSSWGFPGFAALIPTVGTALLLLAGLTPDVSGPTRILGTPAFVAVGTISYSLYLWHWPLLIVMEARFGELHPIASLATVFGSAIPAYLAYRFFENPVRRMRSLEQPMPAIGAGALSMAIAAVGALALGAISSSGETPTAAAAEAALSDIDAAILSGASPTNTTTGDPTEDVIDVLPTDERPPLAAETSARDGSSPTTVGSRAEPTLNLESEPEAVTPASGGLGALSLDEPSEQQSFQQPDSVETIVPDPISAKGDVHELTEECRQSLTASTVIDCLVGDPSGKIDVALVGDSKAIQWLSAVDIIGKAEGWRVVVYSKSNCNYTTLMLTNRSEPYRSCSEWNELVRDKLTTARPDLVLLNGRDQRVFVDGELVPLSESTELLVDDRARLWSELAAGGTQVVVLADSPEPDFDLPECASESRRSLTKCTFPRHPSHIPGESTLERSAADVPGAHILDVNDAICPRETCPVVVGGVLVYRDTHHLTDTYVRTLAPLIATRLREAGVTKA